MIKYFNLFILTLIFLFQSCNDSELKYLKIENATFIELGKNIFKIAERKIIDFIHQFSESSDGIILNAGAYTHTSVAIADAVKAVHIPVVEVHVSNVYAREKFRHYSKIAPYCVGSISGFGLKSYDLAIEALVLRK